MSLSDLLCDYNTKKEKQIREQTRNDYDKLFEILTSFLEDFFEDPEQYVTQEEIMEERALQILNYAFAGYGITLDEAIEKIRNTKEGILTEKQLQEREMFLNVIDNLVEFAVLEEYQMLQQLAEDADESDDYDEFFELCQGTSEQFNKQYAAIENADSWYAMGVALAWGAMANNAVITYYTQGDERVRDSHRSFDGVSYLKSEFPAELIPPIDWACRCYLVESFDAGLLGHNPDNMSELMEKAVNPVFKKPAIDGAIFSSAHPYYDVKESHMDDLIGMKNKIKKNLLG